MIKKRKLKTMAIMDLVFGIFFGFLLFIMIVFGMCLADDIHTKIMLLFCLIFGFCVINFLIYYYCVITIYEVEKSERGIKLHALLVKHEILNNNQIYVTETLKNYIVKIDNRRLLFPKYYTRPTQKDKCYDREELDLIIEYV